MLQGICGLKINNSMCRVDTYDCRAIKGMQTIREVRASHYLSEGITKATV